MISQPDSPNFTQIPNSLLGNIARGNKVEPGLMAELEGSEVKVYLAVCRLTFGYHQNERRASLQMMMELTGLSKPGVHNAANKLEELGLIERNQDGGVTLWKAVVNSVNQDYCQPVVNSVNPTVNSVNQGSKLSLPPSKKETINKPKKETIAEKSALLPNTPHSIMFFEMLALEFDAMGRRPPQKFPSLACKRKFDARAAYLNGNTREAIERAFQKGIMSIIGVTDFIAKWNPNGGTSGNHSSQPSRPAQGRPSPGHRTDAGQQSDDSGGIPAQVAAAFKRISRASSGGT